MLNQALVRGVTVDLHLNQLIILGENPVLVVEHLGETNKQFWNDSLAKAGTQAADAKRGGKLTQQDVENGRRKNRDSVIRYCVRETRGFFHDFPDQPGVPDPENPATDADIPAIINALPSEIFDSVLLFVLNPENFRVRPIVGTPKDIAEK